MTNRGLSIRLMAVQYATDIYIALLDCCNERAEARQGSDYEYRIGIFLKRLDEDDQYARVQCEGKTFRKLKASIWDRAYSPFEVKQPIRLIAFNIPQQVTRAKGLTAQTASMVFVSIAV